MGPLQSDSLSPKIRNFSSDISIYPRSMSKSIETKIQVIRGQRVILDRDLAALYGVSTKRLNEQVTRNQGRFPPDFMFQLSFQEDTDLKSQIATSSFRHGGSRKRPRAFTEHGAIMVANVLNSQIAIDASILLVRIFIRLREVALEHEDLKRRLHSLEQRVAKGFSAHSEELREIRFLIAGLEQTSPNKKSKLGF